VLGVHWISIPKRYRGEFALNIMVNKKPKVVFVIPTLNEEEGIGHTIDKIRAVMAQLGLPYHILVVDGGSTDKTVEVAKSKGAEVIRQREKGYGDAYISGFLQHY